MLHSSACEDHVEVGVNERSGIFKHIILLLLLNVILRALWLMWMHPPQALDFEWYYTHAVQMAEGDGYRQGSQYTAYWPIGYPYFLSLLFRVAGPSVWAGLIANALISIGIVILVYALTLKLTNHRWIALFAALGYTVLPSQLEWNAVLGSEELSTGLVLLSLYIYVLATKGHRPWRILLSGVILGFACDVRPIPLLFPVALCMYELWIRRRSLGGAMMSLCLLFVGVALGVCPVTVRNVLVLHHFVLISTNGGVDLWQGTHTDSAYFWSWNAVVNPLLAAGTNQILEGQIGTHVFIQHAIHHPLWTVFHGILKWFFLYWVDWNVVSVTVQMISKQPIDWLVSLAMWFDTIVYWLWMGVCVIGFWKGLKLVVGSWKAMALPIAYIVYNTAVFFFFPAWDRFRYPLMPLFAIFFGLGIYAIHSHYNSRKQAVDGV